MAAEPIVQVDQLHKIYRQGDLDVTALNGVSLEIRPGEFVVLMGPSGSGKSTLLHILAGIDRATRGSVRVQGVDVARLNESELAAWRNRNVGFVFQSFNLLPRLTVLENVALPLLYRENSDPAANAAAATVALGRVGMSHRLDHRPSQLSGGERQRVAIARAIVGSPSIIFADEPTGNLDVKNVDRILDLLGSLIEEGITVVLVTHDLSVAEKAHRVISMRSGLVQEDRTR